MPSLNTLRWIGGGLVALIIAGFIWSHFAADRDTRNQLKTLTEEAGAVLVATRNASDNPDLKWANAAGQIVALGDSVRELKGAVEQQNLKIDDMAREAVRLKAEAARLQEIADRAEAQRRSALRRLSDMEITPGTRTDCLQLLREAEDALDLVRSAGL